MPTGVVDQIKARLDIVEVVSESVALKKAGKSLKGICPFHTEKTPSFIVFPETGTWHCFGCGAGGDMFTFVMQSRNLEFGEALKTLAARAGVEIPEDHHEGRYVDQFERLYAANDAAANYFGMMLASPAGSGARAYLEKRGVSPESVERFQLGFAPDSGAGLAHHLLQQGFARAELVQAGLAGENDSGGLYDRFRGRLIFTIRDVAGKVIGFGGRVMASGVEPKYLNSPQTPLFDKGGSLYAIDLAKAPIRQTSQAVIVEGYMDALMAHQYGFGNVVASLGTAVTDRQVAQLKKWSSELCFALDPDTAGQEATVRGLAVAMEALDRTATPVPTWKGFVNYVYRLKTTIKIIGLPEGKDPDEVIRANPADWQQLVQSAMPVQDFFLERVRHKHDLSTAEGKAAAVDEAMAVIGDIPEPIQQAHYVQRLATLVGVDDAILLQQVRRGNRRHHPERGLPATVQRGPRQVAETEAYCLALLLQNPSLLEIEPRMREDHLKHPANREIFKRLSRLIEQEGLGSDPAAIHERLREESQGPLLEALDQLLEMPTRKAVQFEEPQDKAYRPAVINLVLAGLEERRRQLDAMREATVAGSEPAEMAGLIRMEQQLATEAHQLKLLGGILPLRAMHKEVRHGE